MKPRIFIGSSVEGLDVAHALQQNLEFDATVTVWTQGIFQLSSNSLDDLLTALENFDFGIFVFKPDDVLNMRADQFNVVRDNVIFELGLFFGKLGKDRVFFVQPHNSNNFHLPSDLLGVLAGKYDANRDDGNLQAALGPFCNQVRSRLTDFAYVSLIDLINESTEAKRIAIEKKTCWEMRLSGALLLPRMIKIEQELITIQKGHLFKKSARYTMREFIKWYRLALTDIIKLIKIAGNIYLVELEKSFGIPGTAGDIKEIKLVAEKIEQVCKGFLAWEVDLQTVIAPDELNQIPKLMKGWSNLIVDEFIRLPKLLLENFSEENIAKGEKIKIDLDFGKELPNIEQINKIIQNMERRILNGELNYD
jgi:hypothetical protein